MPVPLAPQKDHTMSGRRETFLCHAWHSLLAFAGVRRMEGPAWAMGQMKGRSWIIFHGHSGFTVRNGCPCPSLCNTKPGSSSMGRAMHFLLSNGVLLPYPAPHRTYLIRSLFKYKKKPQLKTHFIYGPFNLSKKTKPRNVNVVSVWPQIVVGFFGKVPERLFLGEKHQHFSCGTLIGNQLWFSLDKRSKWNELVFSSLFLNGP